MCELPERSVHNILVDKFVKSHTGHNIRFYDTEFISELACLLEAQYELMKKYDSNTDNEPFPNIKFSVAQILESTASFEWKKKTLALALKVQDLEGVRKECTSILNTILGSLNLTNMVKWERSGIYYILDALWILAAVVEGCEKRQMVFASLDDKLKKFIIKMCTFQLSEDMLITSGKCNFFSECFDALLSTNKNGEFLEECMQFAIDHVNLDFVYVLLEKNLVYCSSWKLVQEDTIWKFVKFNLCDANKTINKKAEDIIRLMKNTEIPFVLQLQTDWDDFLKLVEMSKDRRLYFGDRMTKILTSLPNLPSTWLCYLSKNLLRHNHITVVYKTVQQILKIELPCLNIYKEILGDLLVVLNRFEHSYLSEEMFSELQTYFDQLRGDYCQIFFEEFLKVEWTSTVAWCVLKSSSDILHTCPKDLINNLLLSFEKLPDVYIQQSCVIFFLRKILDDSSDVLNQLVLFGKILFSRNQELSKEAFRELVRGSKDTLTNCTEMLHEMILKAIQDEDMERLTVCLDLMKTLQMDLQIILPEEIPFSGCGDVILLYFPNLLPPDDFETYMIVRSENISPLNNQYFFQLFDTLFEKGYWGFSNDGFIKRVRYNLKESNYNMMKSWMTIFRKCFIDSQPSKVDMEKFHKNLDELLSADDENDLVIVLDNLDLLLEHYYDIPRVTKFLDLCLRKLCTLPKNSMRNYCVVFFRTLFKPGSCYTRVFPECWTKWYSELFVSFMECDDVVRIILEGCRGLIPTENPKMDCIVEFIVDALSRESYRREKYGVYQEIYENVKLSYLENPNINASERKVLCMECLYLFSERRNPLSQVLAVDILEKLYKSYRQINQEKYLQNSKAHLQKLRIIQTILLMSNIANVSGEAEKKLVEFTTSCLCEEEHQPSVKLLLQWLLLRLCMNSNGSYEKYEYLDFVIKRVDSVHTSTLPCAVALLPVIYHLFLRKDYLGYTCAFLYTLARWRCTMKHYKRWACFEIAILNIVKKGKGEFDYKKPHHCMLKGHSIIYNNEGVGEYKHLEIPYETCYSNIKDSWVDGFRDELTFFESFNHETHFSVENILVSVPRMLEVSPFEWQNISQHEWSGRFHWSVLENDLKATQELPSMIYREVKHEMVYSWMEDLEKKIAGRLIDLKFVVYGHECRPYIDIIQVTEKSRTLLVDNIKEVELLEKLVELKKEGYSIVGVEQTSERIMTSNDFKAKKKIAVLLGNKDIDIPANVMPLLDAYLEIPILSQSEYGLNTRYINSFLEVVKTYIAGIEKEGKIPCYY